MRYRPIVRLIPVLISLLAWMTQAQAAIPATASVEAGQWRPPLQAYASVSARRQTRLTLPCAARVTRLAQAGAIVAANAELARIDAPRLRRDLVAWSSARREKTLAGKRLRLLKQSRKEHAATRRDLMAVEQAAAQAEAGADLAWATLLADLNRLHVPVTRQSLAKEVGKQGVAAVARRLGRVLAPFAGIVAKRFATVGASLDAGDPLLELEALDPVYVDVGVPRQSLEAWRGGETFWLDGGLKRRLKPVAGEPRYDSASGLWLLRFEAANADHALRDGQWIRVRHLGKPRPVVWAPAAAVVSRDGKTWVMVRSGEKVKPVRVEVGAAREDGRIPVLQGLRPGQQVVTEGAYELLYRDLKDLIKFVD